MDTSFLTATVITQDLSILVAIIVLAITPKAGRREFLLLGLALLFCFLTEASSMISYFIFHRSANDIINTGSILSSISFLFFYRTRFKSRRIQQLILCIVIFELCFASINMLFIQGFGNTTSYTFVIRSFTLTVISLLYFYVLIRDLPTESITKLPMFWINASFLFYYAGVFFQWLLIDYLINQIKGDVVNTYTIKNALGVVHYILIAIGLWYNRSLFLFKSTGASL